MAIDTGDATGDYTVAVAYIGEETFVVGEDGWTEFETLGKAQANVNGGAGYVSYKNNVPTKVFKVEGNYVALVKYTNVKGGISTDYYTFTVAYDEFVAPTITFDDATGKFSVDQGDAESYKMGLAYIGDQDFEVGVDNWDEFVEKGLVFKKVNGYNGYLTYTECPTKSYTTPGNYVTFIKYTNNKGGTVINYMVTTVE